MGEARFWPHSAGGPVSDLATHVDCPFTESILILIRLTFRHAKTVLPLGK